MATVLDHTGLQQSQELSQPDSILGLDCLQGSVSFSPSKIFYNSFLSVLNAPYSVVEYNAPNISKLILYKLGACIS